MCKKSWLKLEFITFVFILSMIILPGCGTRKPATTRNSLVIGVENNPTNLDPRYATDALSGRIGSLIYNGLLTYDENYMVIPDLAESWEKISDTHFRFKLKRNVKFHDGQRLTARDVKYTFDTLLSEKSKSLKKGSFRYLKEVRVVSEDQVDIILSRPFAPMIGNLTLGIIPENWDTRDRKDNMPPPGTGPFQLVEPPGRTKIVLARFPLYFREPAKLKQLEFRVIRDDSVRMLELLRGSIDLVQNAITPELVPQLQSHPDIRLETLTGTTYKYLGFNLTDPILQDKKVRQAIAHGINRDAIIKGVLNGLAVKASGLLAPSSWAFEPNVKTYPYNPGKSMELLDQAGYPDPDGTAPLPRFKLVYKTSQNKLANRIAEVIKQNLENIGVGIEILRYEWPTFYSDIKKGNFQMFSLTWVGVKDPDIYHYIFHSTSFPEGANRGRYVNKEIDNLLDQARFNLDVNKRKQLYSKVQKILAEDCPYVSLWYETNIVAMRKRVHGYKLYPQGNFWSLVKVRVEPKNR